MIILHDTICLIYEGEKMYKKLVKRVLDFVLALVLFILSFPVVFIAGILILCIDKMKPIFKQRRVGKNQKIFKIYKLQTMKKDKDGVNKVTKFGKFLRATSIDELPQLVNILKGEMSFIGPRPWIESYTKYFTKRQKRRHEVLPGVSGWAQVNGRNDITIKDKINSDLYYVDNVSFLLDLKIVFKTIAIVFKKTGASISEIGISEEIEELKKNKQIVDPELELEEQVANL